MMTQEQKDLLLKDLCARLPHGVKVQFIGWSDETEDYIDVVDTLYSVNTDGYVQLSEADEEMGVDDIKPYLFPMSSMTEEQGEIYHELIRGMFGTSSLINFEFLEEFLNKNHLDWRGLIPMGLANDATGLNIY